MDETKHVAIFGISLILAAGLLGSQLAGAALDFKALDRTVTVKGLAERDVPANIAIWPISFQDASNDLGELYESLQVLSSKSETPDRSEQLLKLFSGPA